MKAKTMTLSVLLVTGGMALSAAHAQTAAQTANISATGVVTNNNGWISSVSVNTRSNPGGGSNTMYSVNFAGAAPSATSCSVTPAVSGLNMRIANPVGVPNVLMVSFTPSVPDASEASAGAATDFVLNCSVAAPAAVSQTTTTTTTTTTTPGSMQGTQTATISSTAAVGNNNGWISSASFDGVTGYPPNAYTIEFAGRSPGAANCQVSPVTTLINGYTFTPVLSDGNDGTSIMVRYAPPATLPNGSAIPAAVPFTLTCAFPAS